MRRWIKVSVAAALVMGLGGWVAEPYAQDWWLAREACGGALPHDAVEQLVPEDTHLEDEEERLVEGLGSYSCRLSVEGGDRFLEATAYTRRDDQDREFMTLFPDEGFSPVAPLPEGMPGFVDKFGDIGLLLPCPDLGTDVAGRQRTLLLSMHLSRNADRHALHAVYATAVALANSASDKLGCGAEPLPVPEGDLEPLTPEVKDTEAVPPSQAKGTACGWLAEAGMPQGIEWWVAVRTNGSAPVSRCDVLIEGGKPEVAEEKLVFLGWYGDWGARLVTWHGKPLSMTATARCQGQSAYYRMSGGSDVPGVSPAVKRQLLEAFARDEARRHGCSGLRFAP